MLWNATCKQDLHKVEIQNLILAFENYQSKIKIPKISFLSTFFLNGLKACCFRKPKLFDEADTNISSKVLPSFIKKENFVKENVKRTVS